jgi:hypothetical protein
VNNWLRWRLSPNNAAAVPLDEATAISPHLSLRPPVNGFQYKSGLVACWATPAVPPSATPDTGLVKPGKASASWLGAAGYMILLDQIGTCFKLDGANAKGDHPITRAHCRPSRVERTCS